MDRGKPKDVVQLRGYMEELGECLMGVLIAANFSKDATRDAKSLGIAPVAYELLRDMKRAQTFDEICQGLDLYPPV
jgi:RecB family endonuclease NucS